MPKNLWQQFQRVANVYFLLIGMLQLDVFFPGLSPTHWSTTIAPLVCAITQEELERARSNTQARRDAVAKNTASSEAELRLLEKELQPRSSVERVEVRFAHEGL